MEGVSDNLILAMAKRIGVNTQLTELALKLGLAMTDAEIFTTMNRMNGEVSTEGTRRMLCKWRNKTPVKKQWATLEAALKDADLAGIADEFSSKVEEKARKVPRSSMDTRSKPIWGAPDPDGDEEVYRLEMREIRRELARLEVYTQIAQFERRQRKLEQLHFDFDFELEQISVEKTLVEKIIEELKRRYTKWDDIMRQIRDFQPVLIHRDRSPASFYVMANSSHDIFKLARDNRRRIVVYGSNAAKLTALCGGQAYNWATRNALSGVLLKQKLVFKLSAKNMEPNQTIESAIKHHLFPDRDDVDEALIRQLLKDMPDAITILLDGFNGKNCGDNIMDVLSGRTLQKVTVMVTTTRHHSADLLDQVAPGVYDRFDMH